MAKKTILKTDWETWVNPSRAGLPRAAFPMVRSFDQETIQRGLSVREYFAAAAMQGLLVDNEYSDYSPESCAVAAVKFADALIKELQKPVK